MIRRKRRAHRVMKCSGRSGDLRRYRILSNAVRDLTRNDHRLYLEEITKDLHTSQKPFWRWLKNMRGSPRTIPDLNHQGQTLSSLTEKVKAFHAYFLSVFTREDTRNLESLCIESWSSVEVQSMLKTCHSVKTRCIMLCLSLIPLKLVALTVFLADS